MLVLNIFKWSSSRHIKVYYVVPLAKKGFTEVAYVHNSLDRSVSKGFQHKVINKITAILYYS